MRRKWLLFFIAITVVIVILSAAACTASVESEPKAQVIDASGEREPKTQVIDMYMGEVKAHGLDSLESVVSDAEKVLVAEFHVWAPNVIVVSKGDTV
ncbi:MAG: hypothetical protein MUP85_14485, partial [Candidatus Lokiarchaeota archaeon]|nr:hypothetical protein [Candidatus Lokiarchaeota archaeon]